MNEEVKVSVADSDLADAAADNKKNTPAQKALLALLSILPWAIVGTLLWAGIFVKPKVIVEEVIPPVINVRDNLFGLTSINSDEFLAVGNYGKIIHSTDKGKTWKDQVSPVDSHFQDISAWDENRAVIVGNEGVTLVTEDGGQTWLEVESPKSEVANKLLRVHTYPNGIGWTVGEMGMILVTTDYGKTWKQVREEEDVFMNDIVLVDESTLFIAGEFGLIFKSVDNGQTWTSTQTDSPNSFTAVAFRTPQEGVVVGLGGAIVGTNDGGETWTYIDPKKSGMDEHLMDVAWSEETQQWVAIGNKGKWIKFSSDLSKFDAKNLSATDYTSHTEMAVNGLDILSVGQTVGALDLETDAWTLLAD
eukprot:gnl/TRDRNA2_/TRDRNA2_175818_c1_seq2.p1 gnl/TRDRNA2_/TRDRNA2_175818_c1~~gnl/TRDRNA2_/TRDRNA2_175818_c1_seq2.p1  ORF type:complete len:361 (-),score=-4.46 gnl/TRDRNA2_/TRDRNA2_175818_c1_seq2:201-1283(-)